MYMYSRLYSTLKSGLFQYSGSGSDWVKDAWPSRIRIKKNAFRHSNLYGTWYRSGTGTAYEILYLNFFF
jgi:hypothetical protein